MDLVADLQGSINPRGRCHQTNHQDYILFYEYFHGDNAVGLGASHQTGWTGVVAKLIEFFGLLDAQSLLDAGKTGAFVKGASAG
jgi:hypothetical protein